MRFSFLFLIGLFLVACESPMNQRVRGVKDVSQERLSFQNHEIFAEVQWLKGPFGLREQENHLLVILFNAAGERVSVPDGLTLSFYATMPSMGHPMDDAGFFTELQTGIYINTAIRYNMPGDWKNELWFLDSEFNKQDEVAWEIFF
jgi:hypothetical protein